MNTDRQGGYTRTSFAVLALLLIFAGAAIGGRQRGVAAAGSASLFDLRSLPCIELELSPEAIASLRRHPRRYVSGGVRVNGRMFRPAGVRLKGAATFRAIDDQPSFTVDFRQFGTNGGWPGPSKFHLNNSLEDPSLMKEQLGSEQFASAGLPAPRVGRAALELNQRALGLYVLKEGCTEEFLVHHFGKAQGDIYETDQPPAIDSRIEAKDAGVSRGFPHPLAMLAAASAEPDEQQRWLRMQEVLDVERFLRFMALEVLLCHWDGYGLARNNFRIYHDPVAGKLQFIPWGMDQILAKSDLPLEPEMSASAARALMEIPIARERYRQIVSDLLANVFQSGRVAARVDEILAELRPSLSRKAFSQIERAAEEIRSTVSAREAFARQSLDQPLEIAPVFIDGVANVVGWTLQGESGEHFPGGSLKIQANGPSVSSWRRTVQVPAGKYRFEALAAVAEVQGLAFGRNQGACIRVLGMPKRSEQLTGTTENRRLAVDFEVSHPSERVTLICELRASGGEANFDANSTRLVQVAIGTRQPAKKRSLPVRRHEVCY